MLGMNRIGIIAKKEVGDSEIPVAEMVFIKIPDSFRWLDMPNDSDTTIISDNGN